MPNPGKRLAVCLVVLSGVHLLQALTLPSHLLSPSSAVNVLEEKKLSNPKPSAHIQNYDLKRGHSAPRQLQAGVKHQYSVFLKKGDFLHALVEQDPVRRREIDVALSLYGPGGKLFDIDSPSEEFGSEEVFLLADASGKHYVEVEGFDQSGTYRIKVKEKRPATEEDRGNARAARLFYSARKLYREKRPAQAVQGYLNAARLWQGVGNKQWQAHSLDRAATILSEPEAKDRKAILELRTKALDLFRSVDDRRFMAKQLVKIGILQRQMGALEQAESSYRQALKISVADGYLIEEAEALMNLGLLLDQKSDKYNALEVYERSLWLWKQRKRIDNQVQVLTYLGLVYSSLGKYQSALSYFQKAERLLTLQPLDDLRAKVFSRLSEAYLRTGEIDLALAYARRALALRRKVGDLRGEATNLTTISLIHREKRDLVLARDAQQQALEIYRQVSDTRSEATARYNLGLILLDQKNFLQALEQFGQGELLARRQKYLEGQIMALYGRALAESLRGNPIAARSVVSEALTLIDSGPRATSSDDSETPYMAARQGCYDLMIHLLVGSPPSYTSMEDKISSFELSERARWGLLRDALTPAQEGKGILRKPDPALLAEYEAAKRKIEATERERKRLSREGLQIPKSFRTQQAELTETLGALEGRLRLKEGSGSRRSTPISLQEAQELLDPNTILLEYWLGGNRSLLWLVTPSSVEVFELPKRKTIEQKSLRLHELLSASQSASQEKQAELLARDLSKVLLGPVASHLGAKRILLVLDGALHYVPFALLPDPSQLGAVGAGKRWRSPLIARHQIVYEPSASVLRALRIERSYRKPPAGLLAVLANPTFLKEEEYSPLPYSEKEAEEILALVPEGDASLMAVGHEANRELVMSGELGNYKYIHFATHGQNHPERPALSGIVLSQLDAEGRPLQGEVRLQDIKDLDLPAELVVLSGCKTALGREMHGEGFVALPQGFMYAGAARVVVSLWNVNDQSTSKLMTRFYQALLVEGQSPPQALRTAQLWMFNHTKWRSPYYWAGFEIQGEWR